MRVFANVETESAGSVSQEANDEMNGNDVEEEAAEIFLMYEK